MVTYADVCCGAAEAGTVTSKNSVTGNSVTGDPVDGVADTVDAVPGVAAGSGQGAGERHALLRR
jgi:hypothetical protein